MTWALLAAVLATPGLLWALSRRRESRAAREWDLVLSPQGETKLATLRASAEADLELIDLAVRKAERHHREGDQVDAIRLLGAGADLIERAAPDLLRALGLAATLSRMVSAIAPVPPLRPRAWQLRELRGLAHMGAFLHLFLVAALERFRLRVAILSRMATALVRVAIRSGRRLRATPEAIEEERHVVVAAAADVRTLSEETLESLRLVLLAMEKEGS